MDFYYNVGKDTVYANVQVKTASDTSNVAFDNIGDLSHKVEVATITASAEDGSTREYRLIIGCGVEIEDGFFDNFDVTAYHKRYPKLSRKYGDDIDAYYEHYLLKGKAAGWDGSTNGAFPSERPSAIYNGVDYAPVFDAEYYLNKYSDLKAAFGNDYSAALNHFITFGIKEGRQACDDFNLDVYKGNYADLRKAFGNNNGAYVAHYLEYGLKEGRDGQEVIQSNQDNTSDDKKDDTNNNYVASAEEKKYSAVYDYIYYRNAYADLRAAFGDDSAKYFQHFLHNGMAEGRQACENFDVKIYKNNYKDLQAAFGNNTALYYTHYMEYGKAENRNATSEVIGNSSSSNVGSNNSNTASAPAIYNGVDYALVYDYEYYKKNYADLRAAFGDDSKKYLQHFVENGMREGRQAKASFNVTAYKNRYADLRAAFGNNNVSYYMHYINNGNAENRNASN